MDTRYQTAALAEHDLLLLTLSYPIRRRGEDQPAAMSGAAVGHGGGLQSSSSSWSGVLPTGPAGFVRLRKGV
jgi:hypothetical protein